jgi:hypothetical protein
LPPQDKTVIFEVMQQTAPKEKTPVVRWLKRLGLAGFMFFFIKGLIWLVVFALAYFGIAKLF